MFVGLIADSGHIGALGAFGTVSVNKVIRLEYPPYPYALKADIL